MTLGFFAHLIVSAALLLVAANAIRGFHISGAFAALVAALVLGLVNAFVLPVALLLTLPLTFLTFGLFLLVVNGLMLKIAAMLVPGFRITGFLPAIWGSLLLTLLNLAVEALMGPAW